MDDAVPGGKDVDTSLPELRRHTRTLRVIGIVILVVIWTIASATTIRAAVRHYSGLLPVGGISEKLLALDEISDDVNLLFIGSSRTYRHVDPSIIKRVAAAEGCHFEPHNLGMSAFSTNEINFVLQWMAARNITIPWIVIEAKGADALRDIKSDRLYEHLRPVHLPLLYYANDDLTDGDGRIANVSALAASYLNVGLVHRYFASSVPRADDRIFGRFGFRPLNWMAPGNSPGAGTSERT